MTSSAPAGDAASPAVVLIAEELSPATVDALGPDVDIRWCDGTDRPELLRELALADALLIRSATLVDAEALAAARRLKVVARAGVGLDNVDVPAATQAGVMVVNAPTSNIVSAAELAVALMLALARNVPRANAALRSGSWQRSAFTGVELSEKTVAVLGLGRIGALVAQRLAAFGMRVLGYDPYVAPSRAAQIGVELVGLDQALAQADFVTVHLPRTPETIGLIGAAELAAAKPGLRVVNAARGGIVDEGALYDALVSGQVAGAGLDVFATEPCTDSPLFGLDNVVVTPHLGASTAEAQENAGVAVARSVRLALAGELVPDAVNVPGGAIAEAIRPGLPLMEKLGRAFTALAGALPVQLDVQVHGEIAALDVEVFRLAALKGLFSDLLEDPVTYVNAPLLAADRGIEVRLVVDQVSPEFRNVIGLSGCLPDGTRLSVAGTLTGPKQIEKLVAIDSFEFEVPLSRHMIVIRYGDRPGVIGTIGGMLGDAGVNIGSMQVARRAERAGPMDDEPALSVLNLDHAVPPGVLEEIVQAIGAVSGRRIDLTPEKL